MKYAYIPPMFPGDSQLFECLNAAASRLHRKLAGLNPQKLPISDYNQRYLTARISLIEGVLQLYSSLLVYAMRGTATSLSDFVLVDYGGGSGMLSYLAKEAGVGMVVYNDIYEVSCQDVRQIARHLGLSIDHIVPGDIDDLTVFIQREQIQPDAIVSYDVIEHVYDVHDFLGKMANLASPPLRVVHASGANIKNRRYVRKAEALQRQREYQGSEKTWGWKERDAVRPFLEIRKEMIAQFAPGLTIPEVEQLARQTRGLRLDDIQKAVEEYLERGEITYRPDHPTNTCDPYTGNWAEHLMDPYRLALVLRAHGFEARVLSGYLPSSNKQPKKALKYLINGAIRLLGPRMLFLAPYYVLYGDLKESA